MRTFDEIYSDAFTKVLGPDGYKPSTEESIEIAKECYNQALEDACAAVIFLRQQYKDPLKTAYNIKDIDVPYNRNLFASPKRTLNRTLMVKEGPCLEILGIDRGSILNLKKH